MSFFKKGAITLAALMFAGQLASADTLNLPGGLRPDIDTGNILGVTYDGTTLKVADGFPGFDIFNLADTSNVDHTIYDASYSITADFDSSHNYIPGTGTLTINGDLLDGYDGVGGPPAALLLSGNITQIGFASGTSGATSGNIINFLFSIPSGSSGGELANIFGSTGGITLTVLDAHDGTTFASTTPSFSNSFYDSGDSVSDTFATVPSPAAFSGGMALLGGLGLAALRSRRRVA